MRSSENNKVCFFYLPVSLHLSVSIMFQLSLSNKGLVIWAASQLKLDRIQLSCIIMASLLPFILNYFCPSFFPCDFFATLLTLGRCPNETWEEGQANQPLPFLLQSLADRCFPPCWWHAEKVWQQSQKRKQITLSIRSSTLTDQDNAVTCSR